MADHLGVRPQRNHAALIISVHENCIMNLIISVARIIRKTVMVNGV
jgi:hypothetical protein